MHGVFQRKVLQDIPELVELLREQREQARDLVAPLSRIWMAENIEGPDDDMHPVLAIGTKNGLESYKLLNWAHGQVATKAGIPRTYYDKCAAGDPELLSTNVNSWLQKLTEAKPDTKVLIRLLGDKIRAVLSNKYRIVDHLDLVTQAVQVVTGQDGDQEQSWARGAKCFVWKLDALRMDLGLVNPSLAVDLNNLDAGVQGRDIDRGAGGYAGGNHNWLRPEQDDGTHFVFPAAFIKNHEGGGGSSVIEIGLYEAICDNTCRIGTSLVKRHIGRAIDSLDSDSDVTRRKQDELVFMRFADTLRQAFDPEKLLALCCKFKDLENKIVDDVKETVNHIVKLNGLTEDLRDDILSAYMPANRDRHTMLDVQRAVTNAANKVREHNYEAAEVLEQTGGRLIEAATLK